MRTLLYATCPTVPQQLCGITYNSYSVNLLNYPIQNSIKTLAIVEAIFKWGFLINTLGVPAPVQNVKESGEILISLSQKFYAS